MNKIPVIIDTDPGIDDTIAIIMAAGSEKIDIKAITTTHGNVGLEGTTKNAMALKEFLGLECPVAKGAAKPMIVSLKDASYVHGENGLAGFELPRPKGTVCEKAVLLKIFVGYDKFNLIISFSPCLFWRTAQLFYP